VLKVYWKNWENMKKVLPLRSRRTERRLTTDFPDSTQINTDLKGLGGGSGRKNGRRGHRELREKIKGLDTDLD